MFYQQPPVGNPVILSETQDPEIQSDQPFSPHHLNFYASGTAALAAAIIAAKRSKPVERPEVILPAYGCPDLVSAAVFAGVRPVLVDLELDRPWLDLQQLANKIGEQTVGIVAVDLFGISERFEALRELATTVNAILIEDSAQGFPSSSESNFWQGDLVVVSFGRGKPVSLLGGGAALHQDQALGDLLPEPDEQATDSWLDSAKYRFKAYLYNRMISPRLYWMPQGLPFLHLGETQYHPLSELGALDTTRKRLLPANLAAYRDQQQANQGMLSNALGEQGIDDGALIDLPNATDTPASRRLLRYPLLVAPTIRNDLFRALRKAGLGPSLMYPAVLPEISGLEGMFEDQGDFPQARSFAERILTLPTHSRVCEKDLIGIRDIITGFIPG